MASGVVRPPSVRSSWRACAISSSVTWALAQVYSSSRYTSSGRKWPSVRPVSSHTSNSLSSPLSLARKDGSRTILAFMLDAFCHQMTADRDMTAAKWHISSDRNLDGLQHFFGLVVLHEGNDTEIAQAQRPTAAREGRFVLGELLQVRGEPRAQGVHVHGHLLLARP